MLGPALSQRQFLQAYKPSRHLNPAVKQTLRCTVLHLELVELAMAV